SFPPIVGNDGILNAGYENTAVTDEYAHTGNYSLKFDIPVGSHDGFVSTKRYAFDDAQPGDVLRISVWIKGANLQPDSAIVVGDPWSISLTAIYHTTIDNNEGWGQYAASNDIPLQFPYATEFDWRKFYVDVTIPDPPAGEQAKSISVRLHPLGRFSGTVWMDDLHVEKLDLPDINAIGSFEQTLPSYWNKGTEPSGATLTWATDQFRSMGKSLKIEKTATADSAMWESDNMVDLWSERHFANVDINLGMYYMTSGVNTNPVSDDEKWYVTYSFYDSVGAVIGVKKFELDQSVASSGGWIADTTAIGEVILPEDAFKTIIRFVGGKNATGTVWADDFIFVGRNGGWAGQDWNTAVGVPTGWFYWLPPIGGNDGILNSGYENTVVTDEYAYDGNYSLKFDIPVGTHDGFVGTKRFALGDIQPGDAVRLSVWVKGANLEPDSAIVVGDPWSVALTAIYHTTINNNDGWGQYAASPDIPLHFPYATEFDWTQFQVDLVVPEPPAGETAKSISVRLHPLGRFSGTVWMDLLEVTKVPVGVTQKDFQPASYNLFQNYPNPFNPSTVISYSIPKSSNVTLKIYDVLGREVKTLVSTEQVNGLHSIQWNGDNNYGSRVSSGIYLYRIEAGDFIQTKKMLLIK
ncbi:MAG TPA: T9SS type A sorting domain-containing protein, partial [Ignavibacteriaceae bacterium]|nr:T9SS type A sorting domain-containing protein [Ignavibacteriaceae bacterium]